MRQITLTQSIRTRAEELVTLGIAGPDAIHIACAEAARCDVLLTVDKILLRRAKRGGGRLRVRVENPLTWFRENTE